MAKIPIENIQGDSIINAINVLSSFRVDIKNLQNTQYIGQVQIGSSLDEANVIFDTGSNWLTVTSDLCSNCQTEAYSPSGSSGSQPKNPAQTENKIEQKYGSADLYGYKVTDDVCMNVNQCVNMPLLAISLQSGLQGNDGILGLGANPNNPNSILKALKANGIIDKAMIGSSLGDIRESESSYMTFGGYNSSQYVGELQTIPLKLNQWWAVDFGFLNYGVKQIVKSNYGSKQIVILDTGTSLAAIPQTVFDDMSAQWKASLTPSPDCSQGICYTISSCSTIESQLQSITFGIGSKSFTVQPKGYLVDGEDLNPSLQGFCIFAFQPVPAIGSGYDIFLLGDTFLRNFYTVYDLDNQQVMLAVDILAQDVASIGQIGNDQYTALIIVAIIVCVTCLVVYFIYTKKYSNKQTSNETVTFIPPYEQAYIPVNIPTGVPDEIQDEINQQPNQPQVYNPQMQGFGQPQKY